METQMSTVIKPWDEEIFLEYIALWHGKHHSYPYSPCGIYDELQKFNAGKSSIKKLIDVFIDVDGDIDSLQQYITDRLDNRNGN
jgi:hypothetical protein